MLARTPWFIHVSSLTVLTSRFHGTREPPVCSLLNKHERHLRPLLATEPVSNAYGDRTVVSEPVRQCLIRLGSTALYPSPGCPTILPSPSPPFGGGSELVLRAVIIGQAAAVRLTRCSYQGCSGPPTGTPR